MRERILGQEWLVMLEGLVPCDRQGECPAWGGQQQREGQDKSRPRGTEAHWLYAIHPPALSASHCVTAMRGPCLSSVPPPPALGSERSVVTYGAPP